MSRNNVSWDFSLCFELSGNLSFSHIIPSSKGSAVQTVTLFTSMQLQLAVGNTVTQGCWSQWAVVNGALQK